MSKLNIQFVNNIIFKFEINMIFNSKGFWGFGAISIPVGKRINIFVSVGARFEFINTLANSRLVVLYISLFAQNDF